MLSRLPGASVTFLAGGGSEPGRAIRSENGLLDGIEATTHWLELETRRSSLA